VSAAEERWREALLGWEIPADILAQAPEPPWGFPPGRFAPPAEPIDSLARRFALQVLPDDGTVLDVGCGAGAASLALVPKAGRIIGVDERETMLDEFVTNCRQHSVEGRGVLGRWPDVAATVETVDVVVCHHVLYNVPDLAPFVDALSEHARHRVVVEVMERHPMAFLRPLWKHFWNLERPDGPSLVDILAVLRETTASRFVFEFESRDLRDWGTPADEVALIRRRLCLPARRDHEVADAMRAFPRPVARIVAITWP